MLSRLALVAALVLMVSWHTLVPPVRSGSGGPALVASPTVQPGDCPVTRPTSRPEEAQTIPMWYTGPDEQIWVMIPPGRTAGGPVKTPWYRPAGSTLDVTGRRLDGPAPPLEFVDPPTSTTYERGSFMPSGLGFPVAGCWEIEARAGGGSLRIVVEILPRFYGRPAADCQDLSGVVASSDAILLASIESTTPDRPGWAWETLRPERIWKGDLPLDGEFLEVLQETRVEPELRPGGRYLLFLQSQPGHPWRIVCDQLTVAEVDGERVIHRHGEPRAAPVWTGATLADLVRQLAPYTGNGWVPLPPGTPIP